MSNQFRRKLYLDLLTSHLAIPYPPIQVVLGPRQVGKTTAILDFLKEWEGPSFYHTADQISPPDALWLERQWQEARKSLSQGKGRGLLVFDEVQKVTRWSEIVKKCFDEDQRSKIHLRVVLLGSSSLLVQRGLSESLAGRFEIVPFPHWSFQECRECFGISLDEYIFYGSYPGALRILLDSHRDRLRWSAYVRESLIETVLNKDILLLTPVTKPALFRQVFSLSCQHAAEILSLNKMLGQLHEAGNASTIASYLKLMDAAMLMKPLERYSGNRIRQKVSSPKLVLLNNALINASLERTFEEARENGALWGRLVENMVGASLVNQNLGKGAGLFYWRERTNEIDFILGSGDRVLGIEVKVRARENGSGVHQFLKRFPQAKCIQTALGGGDLPIEELITLTADEIFSRFV
jgi:predicted AAA+ superfamily ATPase